MVENQISYQFMWMGMSIGGILTECSTNTPKADGGGNLKTPEFTAITNPVRQLRRK
jgi:hypothetical protein